MMYCIIYIIIHIYIYCIIFVQYAQRSLIRSSWYVIRVVSADLRFVRLLRRTRKSLSSLAINLMSPCLTFLFFYQCRFMQIIYYCRFTIAYKVEFIVTLIQSFALYTNMFQNIWISSFFDYRSKLLFSSNIIDLVTFPIWISKLNYAFSFGMPKCVTYGS